tara:strand:+ start:538446 stop:539441 length:996 start_codon:yes stop_codon:yes gene_type:complete
MHYGRSFEDVESVLRIRTVLLEAIEADDSAKLPGRVYAIGFIRSYAEYLGLDGAQIVELYKQQLGQSALRPEYNFPVGADESKRPGASIFVVSIVGLLLVGACYHFLKPSDEASETSLQVEAAEGSVASETTNFAQIAFKPLQESTGHQAIVDKPLLNAQVKKKDSVWPPKVEDVMPEMISSLKIHPAENVEIDVDATDITSEHAASNLAVASLDEIPVNENIVQSSIDPVAAVEDAALAAEDGASIRIVAKDPTWMQIKDTEGAIVFTGILKKGSDIKVPAGALGWRMDTGNAGGLDIYIGDDKIAPLGGNGIVVRRIPLFADALRDYGR